MDVLQVRDARKKFAAVTALDGASFELRQGELLACSAPTAQGRRRSSERLPDG